MDEMAMETDSKNQQPGSVLLIEAGCALDRGQNCAAQAVQLLDETVRNLALPQEVLEKIHGMVSDAIQEVNGDNGARADIRFHISVTESRMQSPPQNLDIGITLKDAHHPWGMFLVRHSETNVAGRTGQRIELCLYREIG